MPFLVPAQGAECLSRCGLRKGLHRPQGDPAGLGGALWRKELRLPQALHPQAFIPPSPPMAVLRASAVTSPTFQRL